MKPFSFALRHHPRFIVELQIISLKALLYPFNPASAYASDSSCTIYTRNLFASHSGDTKSRISNPSFNPRRAVEDGLMVLT